MQLAAAVWGIASMLATAAPATAPAGESSARVTVVAVSEEPPFPSGIVATFVALTVWTAGSEEQFLIPFMEPGQARPEPGAKCTLAYRRFGFQGLVGPRLESVTGGMGIVRYQCDGDPPVRTGF